MKKQIIIAALFLVGGIGAWGQNVYDAANIINKDLSGTARFVGMGGAMGALGGDISTMGVNPAGIGIFRSNDISTSLSFSTLNSESKYDGNTFSADKNRWALNNIGAVFSTKIGDHTALRYVNFGFNYQRVKSFYRDMNMEGTMHGDTRGYISQVRQMAEQANGSGSVNYGSDDIFSNGDAGWLAALGYNGWLVDQNATSGIYHPLIPNEPYSKFRTRERGGVDQYDFNVAFNVSDRAYFGLSIGAYDVDYTKSTMYDEDYKNKEGYTLTSWSNISGTGFDFKFGTILRPFEDSPLRIGLAVHTPTFYNLTLETNALLESDILMNNDEKPTRYTIDTYNKLGGNMKRDFKLNTPWKYNMSLGYTVGSSLALGAEYEYQDYSTMKFKYDDGYDGVMEPETSEAKAVTKGVNVLRLGAEYKVIPEFAFRLGYNYTSAIFKNDAIKALPVNSIQTDTDFSNTNSRNDFTLGIGYRGTSFYADLAYKFTTYKSDFYPFYNDFYKENGDYDVTVRPDATRVTDSRSQVLLTMGFRF